VCALRLASIHHQGFRLEQLLLPLTTPPRGPCDGCCAYNSSDNSTPITGGRLVELHRDWAVIDLPVNRSQRIFYRRNVDPAKITLPWVKQASLR
jgi:hypothetical protein